MHDAWRVSSDRGVTAAKWLRWPATATVRATYTDLRTVPGWEAEPGCNEGPGAGRMAGVGPRTVQGVLSMGAESEAFERMYRSAYPAVRAYVRRRVAAEDVDDVVAETFLAA